MSPVELLLNFLKIMINILLKVYRNNSKTGLDDITIVKGVAKELNHYIDRMEGKQ